MHTITNCPRCKIDFMYHTSDIHLIREVTAVGNNEIFSEYICQDCHNVEEYINDISIQYNLATYEDYKEDVKYFWENGSINELEADGLITVDEVKYREDGRLSSQSFRILTEEEFNSRFKIYPETDYPYQDNIWPSRRWNKNYNDYIDLGGTAKVKEDKGSDDLPF